MTHEPRFCHPQFGPLNHKVAQNRKKKPETCKETGKNIIIIPTSYTNWNPWSQPRMNSRMNVKKNNKMAKNAVEGQKNYKRHPKIEINYQKCN